MTAMFILGRKSEAEMIRPKISVLLACFLVLVFLPAATAQEKPGSEAVENPAEQEEGIERLTAEDHFKRGTSELEAGKIEEAMKQFAEALRLKPDFREAWYNLALAHSRRGNVEGEIAAYREALNLDPDYAKAHDNLGIALEETGRLLDAVDSYRRAGELDEAAYDARMNLGVVLALLGRLEESVAAYRGALKVNDQVPDIYYNMGIALSRLAKRANGVERKSFYDQALNAYTSAVTLKPNFYKAEYNRALILHTLGRTAEEIEAFKRAIKSHPRYPQALYNLAHTCETVQRYAEALSYWEAYLKVASKMATEAPYVPTAERAIQRLRAVVQATPTEEDDEEEL